MRKLVKGKWKIPSARQQDEKLFPGDGKKKDQLVQISFENNAKTFWKDS